MVRFVALLAVVGAAAAVLLWPDREDFRPSPRAAMVPSPSPTGPLARGIERSRAVITVRQDDRAYELRGGLDLSEGYRFRGRITDGGDKYLKNGTPIWLAGGQGTWAGAPRHYDTLTKPALFNEPPIWFDDHAPTLPLTRDLYGDEGAEVYAHLALVALKHGAFGRAYDFAPPRGRPAGYDELRGAELAAGKTDLDVSIGDVGRVERLQLELGPATVDVRLFASDRPVPALKVRRFAME